MASRFAGRRPLTALGMYAAAGLGVVGQVLAARWLGVERFGILALVLSVSAFVQILFDLTVEEVVVKYGFRYVIGEEWGRLRRLLVRAVQFKMLGAGVAAAGVAAFAPAGDAVFGHRGLLVPILISAALPLVSAPEGLSGAMLLLRGRYDLRSAFLVVTQATRFAALFAGSRLGVTATIAFLVLAQIASTSAVAAAALSGIRRFPRAKQEPLGADRRDIIRFVKQSAIASTLTTAQGSLPPILLGIVANPVQVGLFRVSLAPQSALATLSSPIRLILLTDQTRDWEKGDELAVLRGVRRFTLVMSGLMAVLLPPGIVFMPELVRLVYTDKYAAAGTAARFVLLASALLFVTGWSKSLPVSAGRPELRMRTLGLQAAVLLPLVPLLGLEWHATGASAAMAVSSAVYSAVWFAIAVRMHGDAVRRRDAAAAGAAPSAEPPTERAAALPGTGAGAGAGVEGPA